MTANACKPQRALSTLTCTVTLLGDSKMTGLRHGLLISTGSATVIITLLIFANDWIPWLYEAHAPTPRYAAPSNLAEAQRDDLDYRRHFTRLDRSYTTDTRAAAIAAIDATLRRRLPLSPAQFQLQIARVLALADNGHTNVRGGSTANRFNRLPLRLYRFADGIFVVRALPPAARLLGARLLAIDGIPVDTVAAQLAGYTGGSQSEKNARLPFYLESPELLHAAGLALSPEHITVRALIASGALESFVVTALPADPSAPKRWPSEELEPVSLPAEDPRWPPALRGKAESVPLFANAPHPFYAGWLAGSSIYYVRFDINHDDGATSIRAFATRTLKALCALQPQTIVVDLRLNGGGDYTNTADFMRSLPARLPAAVIYVLLSQETFSAGMTDAAFLKQAGGERVIFVGDLPGDRMRFYSEGSDFCLPYSGICVTANTAIHDYSTRDCRPLLECYLLDRLYPVAISSFAPDVPAPLTYSALAQGHDPALDVIVAHRTDTHMRGSKD